MKVYKLQLFYLRTEICNLFKKTFSDSVYSVNCIEAVKINKQFLENYEGEIDCVILDSDMDAKHKELVKSYFKDKPIICLPSLESDTEFENGSAKCISEPLKLSELTSALDEIFKNRK